LESFYICATASIPLAASLVTNGIRPDTAFVFLLARPAANATTITIVACFLGKRFAALYVGMISLCALTAGILLDWIHLRIGISASLTQELQKNCFRDFKVSFVILLHPVMLYGIFRKERECSCPECH
jgi:hypothetical protein